MNEKTAWEAAAEAEGITESERALTKAAKKAFLSLWSYPNVFTDEGRASGRGDGKELCDLLVVFGNNVLLFSDKSCEYKDASDVNVAWQRWYKKAIAKSVRQLAGAEKFLRAYPQRVFIDRQCQTPLPVPLPSPDVAQYFLIAVTRGAHQAAAAFFGGGSSGSVMLDSTIRGDAHHESPFTVGFPLESGRFVHVLDEVTLDLLLEELDTLPDVVSYLTCKEGFFCTPGIAVSIPGEEDLLARYMLTMRDGQHALPEIPTSVDFVALPEGEWQGYTSGGQRATKRRADEISYLWDSLIEHQSRLIRAGTARGAGSADNPSGPERVVRALAEQNRLIRRQCGTDLQAVLGRTPQGGIVTKIQMSGTPPTKAIVFLAAEQRPGLSESDNLVVRRDLLTTYCTAIKAHVPTLREAIGVAGQLGLGTDQPFEFVHVDHSVPMSPEESARWTDEATSLGILRPETRANETRGVTREFPEPFYFGTDSIRLPGNREDRRRAAREARRAKGKQRR